MATERLGFKHLEWQCPGCNTVNPGSQRLCGGCGAAQPDDVTFSNVEGSGFINDDEVVRQAKAGADVHCGYCNTRNHAGASTCRQCGGDLGEGERRTHGHVVGQNPVRKPQRFSSAKPAKPAKKSSGKTGKIILAVLVLGLLFIGFKLTRKQELTGTVQQVGWTRTIALEALEDVNGEDWRSDLPDEARVLSCSKKLHHTQENAVSGANKVCGEPYEKDLGNGFSEVVRDCEYEVFADWCKYTERKWKPADELQLVGSDFSPRWPDVRLPSGQREGEREERYRVVFDVGDETQTYSFGDADRLPRYQVGSRWKLTINGFDNIVDTEPLR